jgi:hypothetical protein
LFTCSEEFHLFLLLFFLIQIQKILFVSPKSSYILVRILFKLHINLQKISILSMLSHLIQAHCGTLQFFRFPLIPLASVVFSTQILYTFC